MKLRRSCRRASLPAALSCLALVSATPALAQSTVIVTGAREPIPVERMVADVVVIDRERIRNAAADSVEELLRREAGIQVSRNGGPGANTGLFIRGATSGQTLVLVDGVRVGAATTGLAEFEGMSLAAIERIEVLRGPASSLYGADAVGGVVQIFTRQGQGPARFGAQAAVGGYAAHEASVSGSGSQANVAPPLCLTPAGGGLGAARPWGCSQGAIDFAATLASEGNQGVSALRPGDQFGNHNPDRDGFARRTAHLRAGVTLSPGQRLGLTAQAGRLDARYDGSEFLPPTFAQDASPDFRNRLATQAFALEHDARWSPALKSLLRLSSQRSDLESGGAQIDRFMTDRQQFQAQATWMPQPGQQLTLAVERLREHARSTSYVEDARRDTNAVVLAYAGAVAAIDLQADLRHDDNSVWGGVDTGRVGAGIAIAPGLRLRALAGTTFRAPSFNDLYFPGFGVATLQPERGRSVELGLTATSAAGDISLTVYRNRVRDLVAYEPDRQFCPAGPDYDFGCARNIGRARLQGATLQGGRRLGAWTLRGTFEVLDAKDAATGSRLTRRAAHQESLSADYKQGAWSAGAELLRVGARPESGAELAAYTTVDLKARWQLAPAWQLVARLLNATDRRYEPARDYQSLGRQAWLGLRFDGGGL